MDDYSAYAQFYDLDHGGLDADLMMIEQLAALCGPPILELACGTGRALLPLARQGYQVTGVDISPKMLADRPAQDRGRRAGRPGDAGGAGHAAAGARRPL